jgi:hypothetical protein
MGARGDCCGFMVVKRTQTPLSPDGGEGRLLWVYGCEKSIWLPSPLEVERGDGDCFLPGLGELQSN